MAAAERAVAGSTDTLGGVDPNPTILAGGGRAVQWGQPLKASGQSLGWFLTPGCRSDTGDGLKKPEPRTIIQNLFDRSSVDGPPVQSAQASNQPTRRSFLMNTVVSLPIAAALPVAAPAMVPTIDAEQSADPIFAAIDRHRRAGAECDAVPHGVDIPDELGDRLVNALRAVMRTRPTTPAGLAALTAWTREKADWLRKNGSTLYAEDLCALAATIDDAARGMTGLKAWSPAVESEKPSNPTTIDKELLDLGQQFEGLLAIEVPLEEEFSPIARCSQPTAVREDGDQSRR